MTKEQRELLSSISQVFVTWIFEEKKPTYNPSDYDPEIAEEFMIKLLRKKLEWAGVKVIIPDYCALILAMCAETPADIQIMTVDLLTSIMDNHNYVFLPDDYIITGEDFCNAFGFQFPATTIYPEVREEYTKKWQMSKIKMPEYPNIDTMYDTYDFWALFRPCILGKVDSNNNAVRVYKEICKLLRTV